jgi:hypothetical protein
MRVGALLREAQQALDYGEFGGTARIRRSSADIAVHLPHRIYRLIAIAEDARLLTHASKLPPSLDDAV